MPPTMTETQQRTIHAQLITRADSATEQTGYNLSGVAVPFGEEYDSWGFREAFDPACEFEGMDSAKLCWQHRDAIGKITAHSVDATGLRVDAAISKTPQGDEAATLVRDGVIDSLSIGFHGGDYRVEQRDDGTELWVWTRVRIREVSLVSFPAYESATLTEVRNDSTPSKENPEMPETITREDLTALQSELGEQIRQTQGALAQLGDTHRPTASTRSAGQMLRAIAGNDADAISEYNALMERAYEGGTTADAPNKDGWVGDLTRIFDSSAGILSAIFATGTLPDKGMNIEYAQLKSNTVKVEKQTSEGADLPIGKVTLETKTAPVETYGGYAQLTLQQINRSTLPILDRTLEAMTLAAGARKKTVLRAAYLTAVAAQVAIEDDEGVLTLGSVLASATPTDWTNLIVDAAVKYDSLNLALDGMIVSTDAFKHLNALEIAGKRVFKVSEDRDTIGTLDLPGLKGNLGGITVLADPGRKIAAAEFFNSKAIRQYDSAVTQLQDENILNLSKSFSVYKYGAVAIEIPSAIIPVKFAE